MLRSMTGYGKGQVKKDGYDVIAEIKTVNHKYTNIYLHMPNYLMALESDLKKLIKDEVSRGRIDLYLQIDEEEREERYTPQINMELAENYYNEIKKLEENLDFSQSLSIDKLISLPEVLKVKEVEQDEETLYNVIKEAVNESLRTLVEMREEEGRELCKDLIQRLDLIEEEVEKIKGREKASLEEHKERLEKRVNDLLEENKLDEERLAMEIAILAEKSGINEELVRLKSHLSQFRSNLDVEGPIGRKLDFIAQEMHREANTIGSKAIDAEISSSVVNIKGEIDKIREQIQNVE